MAKRPKTRHDFLSDEDELNYLSDMIRFYLQTGRKPTRPVESLLHRFHDILACVGLDNGSIMLQDHWALLHEAEGRVAQAIEHREREIELIERLFAIGGPVGDLNEQFLTEVLNSLHQDFLHVGNVDKANTVLQRIEVIRSKNRSGA
jgi:hypothetical protein